MFNDTSIKELPWVAASAVQSSLTKNVASRRAVCGVQRPGSGYRPVIQGQLCCRLPLYPGSYLNFLDLIPSSGKWE